jgi:hypothetical protein
VRWWATEPAVARCLVDGTPEALRHATRRLGQILDSYTVYADLVVADADGTVIANGRPTRYRSVGARVDRTEWFRSAMATRSGQEFGFQSMHDSELVERQSVLAYSCAVRDPDSPAGAPLGVLGILFKWKELGQTVVEHMPLSEAEWTRTRVCLVDDNGRILADTRRSRGVAMLEFAERDALFRGKRGMITANLGGRPALICHAASPGFETYRTGWHAVLIRGVDSKPDL